MRPDEEIERLLEDWLEDEAQSVPRGVLENVLESVARTPQGTARPSGGWLRARPIGFMAAAALLALAVVTGIVIRDRLPIGGPLASSSATPTQEWRQDADFLAHMAQNPAPDQYGNLGVWSYLSSGVAHQPSAYQRLPEFSAGKWLDSAFVNVHVYSDRGLVLHPYADAAQTRYIILAWSSPISGEVAIRGFADMLQRTCPATSNGVELSIDRGSTSLLVQTVPAGQTVPFSVSAVVQRDDSIYFVVDPMQNSSCDSTALTLTITTVGADASAGPR